MRAPVRGEASRGVWLSGLVLTGVLFLAGPPVYWAIFGVMQAASPVGMALAMPLALPASYLVFARPLLLTAGLAALAGTNLPRVRNAFVRHGAGLGIGLLLGVAFGAWLRREIPAGEWSWPCPVAGGFLGLILPWLQQLATRWVGAARQGLAG